MARSQADVVVTLPVLDRLIDHEPEGQTDKVSAMSEAKTRR